MAVKPKLAMIPSGVGTDTLYSVLPADGTGDFTFDRNLNTATRINKDGLIEMVDADVPRLNYPLIDGVVSGCPSLLLEPARTNLITYSEDFSQWSASDVTVTDNNAISPDGSLNASKLTLTSGTSVKRIALGSMPTSSASRCYSIFFKTNDINSIQLLHSGDLQGYANFDLVNSVVGTSGSKTTSKIENYGNGWFRCTAIFDNTNGFGSTLYLYIKDNASGTYGGNTSQVGDLFIFGAMYEQGSYATSYIPSLTGSITTRSAETCNSAGDANTFNDSEGVLMAEISALNDTVDGYNTINIGSNSADNRLGFGFDDQSRIYGFKRTTTSWNTPIEANINEFNKVAISYNTNDNHFWLNGFKVDSNTTIGDITQPIELDFRASYGGEQFYGSAKQIQYFDTVLNDTDLETLTSWTSFNEMATSQLYSLY